MPEGAKERGVGLSGTMDSVAVVEQIIFDKLNARRRTSLAPSPAEVWCIYWRCTLTGCCCGLTFLAVVYSENPCLEKGSACS